MSSFGMVFAKAPMRISFIGGGSDLEQFWRNYGDCEVISCAIRYYSRAWYFTRSLVGDSSVFFIDTPVGRQWSDTIKHIDNDYIRAVFARKIRSFRKQHLLLSDSDAGIGKGLGSSGAFSVCMAGLFYPRDEVLRVAIDIESRVLQKPVGWQDPIISFYGGFKHIRINKAGKISVVDLPNIDWLSEHLLLFEVIDSDTKKHASHATIREMGIQMQVRKDYILKTLELVPDFLDAVQTKSIGKLGYVLDDAWQLKLKSHNYKGALFELYNYAMSLGGIGGKVTGSLAGSSGHLIILAPRERHKRIVQGLRHYCIPMKFVVDTEGFGACRV